jgi:hypothetical protein
MSVYIPPSRETVYSTLFAMLQTARLNGFPAWATSGRGPKSQEQINGAEKPAMFMLQAYEEWTQNNSGLPYVAHAVVEVYVFVQQPDSQVVPVPQLNNLIDAALATLAPPLPGGKQTLGGLVDNVVLRGKAEYFLGLAGIINAFAVFPITLIQPGWQQETPGSVVSGTTVTAFVGAGTWSEGAGVPGALTGNGNYYLNLLTGDVYLQQNGAWGSPVGNIQGGGGGGGGVPSSTYHKVSAAGTNAASLKSAAGTVAGWKIYNNADYPIFVKLFDKPTAPIPGTDTPKQVVGVQAGLGDVVNGPGFAYVSGIGFAITKGIEDDDDTPVEAEDCTVDIFYL